MLLQETNTKVWKYFDGSKGICQFKLQIDLNKFIFKTMNQIAMYIKKL